METENVWIAADLNGAVYMYEKEPKYFPENKAFNTSGKIVRLEPFDGKIEPGSKHLYIETTTEQEENEFLQDKAFEILVYFINSGKITVTDALENTERIKKACYELAKTFLKENK